MGGGLMVMISGWRILNQQSNVSDEEPGRAAQQRNHSCHRRFYPLTMPLTVGPGSIAVALTLGGNAHAESHMQHLESAIAATLGVVLIGHHDLSLLSILRRTGAPARPEWHQHRDSPVGVHPGVHRNPDHVQRRERVLYRNGAEREGRRWRVAEIFRMPLSCGSRRTSREQPCPREFSVLWQVMQSPAVAVEL